MAALTMSQLSAGSEGAHDACHGTPRPLPVPRQWYGRGGRGSVDLAARLRYIYTRIRIVLFVDNRDGAFSDTFALSSRRLCKTMADASLRLDSPLEESLATVTGKTKMS